MTQANNDSFVVRFVSAERGVKSEARVQGRIAFSSNRGPQPQAGEFWRVTIQGENPKKTVFFLTCVEKVDQPADYKSPKVENKPDQSNQRGARNGKHQGGKRNDQKRNGDRNKGDRPNRDRKDRSANSNEAPRVWSFGPSTDAPPAQPVAEKIFAPGADAYEQANAWLTPVVTINLANLKFAHAQKLAAGDELARAHASAMRFCLGLVDDARGTGASLKEALKGLSQNDRDIALECVNSERRLSAANQAKQKLQLDTLSFGRLKQSYKKQGKCDDAEANAHLAAVKDELDRRRLTVNAEFEAAKNLHSDSEMARHFAYSVEEVDRGRALIVDITAAENILPMHMGELKAAVKRYEDRIDEMRKAA